MSWAQELKSLVEDIQASTAERLRFMKNLQKGTTEFLKESEGTRLSDFKTLHQHTLAAVKRIQKEAADVQKEAAGIQGEARAFMGRVRRDLKELAAKLAEFLKASEHDRKADFASMMKEIAAAAKEISASVAAVRRDAQTTLHHYGKERAEAASHWASLHQKK